MPKSKKTIKVRDLKPAKDAKGGGHPKPTGAATGTGKDTGTRMTGGGVTGANTGPGVS
jgi:hypothetical protein